MFRAFLLVLTAGLVLALVDWHYGGIDIGLPRQLTGSHPIYASPTIQVTSAPTDLALHATGNVTIQAQAPAVPGDVVLLETAGPYGLGYNKVSATVLDDQLQATLPVTGRDTAGSFKYFALMRATGKHRQGRSAMFTITIDKAPPPASTASAGCGGSADLVADGETWQCTYDDEFDGTELDRSYWVPQTGGSTTGSSTMYACAVDSPDTVRVANGTLDLSLVQLPAARKCTRTKSSQYAYGQVTHYGTFSQAYGKFEVRAKIPDITVPGVQQSFWLWPVKNTYGAWPASGEIDFAELYSSTPGLDRPYLHYIPGETIAGSNDNITNARCAMNPGQFNTYGLEWKPGQLTVLLNDKVCFTDDYSSALGVAQGSTAPFDKAFFLCLTQAMGTLNNSLKPGTVSLPVTTEIDYVRVWKLAAA
ncbi:MAG TPA: glycoside hydrolase family 16 protein [Marmoricola sp.]|nr:glycoside hydrolase family 16 protein [Marmoricola sp.]